jgi:hypothetical protein
VKLCFGEIENWRKRSSVTEPIHYVFESGTKGPTGELLNVLFKYAKTQADALPRYGLEEDGFYFQRKGQTVRLQAADILAWESCHQMRNVIFANKPRKPRKSYMELLRKNHAKVFYVKRQQIEKWVKQSRQLEASGESAFLI